MAIEFACQCGSRFQVEDEMAGRRARCDVCRQFMVIPTKSRPIAKKQTVVSAGAPSARNGARSRPQPPDDLPDEYSLEPFQPNRGASSNDPWMDQEIRKMQELTQSAASNPGRLRISHLKHWLSFPLWPTLWTALALAAAGASLAHWAFCLLALPFVALLWLYWWVQRNKFISGCTNPTMVVSVEPPLVAVYTDLNMNPEGRKWHFVKVLPQPLGSMTGAPARIGQRLASVATYKMGDSDEHWTDFWPVVVNCVTGNESDIARVLATLQAEDWRQLDTALRQVPRPFSPGLYPVQL